MRKLYQNIQRIYAGLHRSAHSAQSLVEFSLVLPILLLIMVGVVDLGRAYYAYMTLINVAREGASYGATNPAATDIDQHAAAEAANSSVNPAQLTVTHSFPNGCVQGENIQVNVQYNFQFYTAYIFGINSIPIRSSAQMAVATICP